MNQHLAKDQWRNNVAQARRVMAMLPEVDFEEVITLLDDQDFDEALFEIEVLMLKDIKSDLVPHPLITIANEIRNARMYFDCACK